MLPCWLYGNVALRKVVAVVDCAGFCLPRLLSFTLSFTRGFFPYVCPVVAFPAPFVSKAEGNERRLSPAFLELARQKALYENLEVSARVHEIFVVALCEVGGGFKRLEDDRYALLICDHRFPIFLRS